MSGSNNRIEDISGEEDRSEDSSTMSSRLRDFMIPDNAYSGGVDRDDNAESRGSGNQELAQTLTRDALEGTQRVTILNTLGEDAPRQEVTGGNGRGAGGSDENRDARSQVGEGDGLITSEPSRRTLMRETLAGLHRADLSGSGTNSSLPGGDVSTLPEDHESEVGRERVRTLRERMVPQTPVGSGATRVIRHPTTMQVPDTLTTQEAGRGVTQTHPTVRNSGRDKTQGSGHLSLRFMKPRNVEEPEGKVTGGQSGSRGVRLDKDFYGDEDEEEEEGPEDQGLHENEDGLDLLEKELAEVHEGLLNQLERVAMYTTQRKELVEAEGYGNHPELQERLEMVERLGVLDTHLCTSTADQA